MIPSLSVKRNLKEGDCAMVKVSKALFDIKKICNSGQIFRYFIDNENKCYRIHAFINGEDRCILIRDTGDVGFYEFDCTEEDYIETWENYFDLSVESTQMYSDFSMLMIKSGGSLQLTKYLKDITFLETCEKYSCGIRILNQDPWEVIVSFIISQNNNIPKIKSTISKICKLNDNKFPNPEELYHMDLSECSLGYRKKYLEKLAEKVVKGQFDIKFLKYYKYPYELRTIINELKQLDGVGDKVANCIALYGYHFLNAFPVDVWVKRIIEKKFKHGMVKLSNAVDDPYCSLERTLLGLTQQYMYYYAINHKDEFK